VATLSQIRAWDTDHLVNAASHWSKTADQWDDVFRQMRNESHALDWQGAGGDALRQRTSADLPIVSGKADQLRRAAGIARTGAGDISAAARRVLYAVEDAQDAGFTVGEDLSVTDTRESTSAAEQAARQAQAKAFAGDISARAAQLQGEDRKVAGQLTATTAGLGTDGFAPAANGPANGNIRLVDFTQNQSPPPPIAPLDMPDGAPPPGTGLSPKLQQMLLGENPASLTGQGLVDNVQRFVQSLPENDPSTAYLRGQLANLQAHVADIDYARTHCSTSDWIERTSLFSSGVLATGIGAITAPTGAGLAVAAAGGVGTAVAGMNLLKCLTGSK